MSQPLGPEPVVASALNCMDCGAPISGNYCSNCGQETRIQTPTVRQFMHELMDQYVAVEGKLGRTLRVLVTRPGQLTLDYVEGRRQRYVRPLKLYVSISVVFFGLLGILPDSLSNPFVQVGAATQQPGADPPIGKDGAEPPAATGAAAPPPGAAGAPAVPPPASPAPPARPGAAAGAATPAEKREEQDLKAEIERDIAEGIKSGNQADLGDTIKRHVNAEIKKTHALRAEEKKERIRAGLSSPEERERLRARLIDEAPYAMFFLLPYFALLLRWLYRGNKQLYGVHLLFSVHLHCFAFLLLMVMLVPWQPLRTALEVIGAGYAFLALRRVYGGTWQRTLWRMAVLYFLYIAAAGATALSGVMTAAFGNSL
ncbi:MAG TPA: DUF3667 domain-containing protein [Nevskia sp.]|nr:DUF3667 domain-containing protein [Nevskia sp.]